MTMTKAMQDVIAERGRQVSVEGWTPEHDDTHGDAQLAWAAMSYAYHAASFRDAVELGAKYDIKAHPTWWPWDRKWWKPKNPRRDLVRAAALIIAEIERLDRRETTND